mgnify:CR=1 FL=1
MHIIVVVDIAVVVLHSCLDVVEFVGLGFGSKVPKPLSLF